MSRYKLNQVGDTEREFLRAVSGTWGHPRVAIGDYVQSKDAPYWYAQVEAVGICADGQTKFVVVKAVCTEDGRPYKKPFCKRYHPFWFKLVLRVPLMTDAIKT